MGGEHKYMFDSENLINILKICGFNSAETRAFGHQLDLPGRDFESIYATAKKHGQKQKIDPKALKRDNQIID